MLAQTGNHMRYANIQQASVDSLSGFTNSFRLQYLQNSQRNIECSKIQKNTKRKLSNDAKSNDKKSR
jgi:hypothetical protein